MKLRNKVLAGLTATVLALSMMMGTAMASTDALPYAIQKMQALQRTMMFG